MLLLVLHPFDMIGYRKANIAATGFSAALEHSGQLPFMACVPWVIAPPARNAAATRTASAIS